MPPEDATATVVDPLMTLAESGPAITEPPVAVDRTMFEQSGERYEIVRELGRGGMGEVVLSRDRRIGRTVAIKRSHEGRADRARFFREICVQGQLEHPTVVPLYDVDVSRDGDISFTMKCVRGRTLRSILDAAIAGDANTLESFTRRKFLSGFVSVCQGVAYAHSRGVVHRDLKPENTMLGEFGEVYVLDWGVARLGSGPADDDTAERLAPPVADGVTREGSVIGTPGYMAPEQCRGITTGLDQRADVYALGAILFELLTYRRLHPGDAGERITSTLGGADARASVRAPDREVPPELEAICVRATAMKPEDRYASARELAVAVERYLDDDRDLELRRGMAERHADAAAAAAEKLGTTEDSADVRRDGLAEAGRAIALDPGNARARRAMFTLLTEPPREIPAEAKSEMAQAMEKRRREGALLGVGAPLILGLCIPFMVKMGVLDARPFIAFYAFIFYFMISCAFVLKSKHPSNKMTLYLGLINMLPYLALGFAFGPLVVIPSFCLMNAVVFQLYLERNRYVMVASAAVPIALPVVLVWLGVLPSAYDFSSSGMTIVSRMLDFHDRAPTVLLLLVFNLSALLVTGVVVARDRASLLASEQKLILNAWQLRQILPKE
jgi:serine/threonine-protein kinase